MDSLFCLQGVLENMSGEEFLRHLDALIQRRLEKPKKMSSLTARWWTEIVSNQYNFDRETIEVDYLRTVTQPQLVQHFKVTCNMVTHMTYFFKIFNFNRLIIKSDNLDIIITFEWGRVGDSFHFLIVQVCHVKWWVTVGSFWFGA